MKRSWLIACVLLLPAVSMAATTSWTLPAPEGAAQPQLIGTPHGELLLSWIERREPRGHRMRLARQDAAGRWGVPTTIAEGDNWFVNWADVPAVQILPDGSLWAHTLEKSAPATYAYDVMLRRSGDGGRSWSAPVRVHDDGTQTEHGFVSLWPAGKDRMAIAWLDGRHTGGGGHDGHGGGMMTLRAAVFDKTLNKRSEWLVDASTCECCQTDAALSEKGTVLVYRDRTDKEIRDIYLSRLAENGWSKPVRVHRDDWLMPACPVNGPSVAALGQQVWVAWPTEAGGRPSLRLARSQDAGASFAPMQEVDGVRSLGRVDLQADANSVWVLWMQEHNDQQSLWLARYGHALGKPMFQQKIADVQGRGRGTGFPRLQFSKGIAHVVWTEVVDGKPRLRGVKVQP